MSEKRDKLRGILLGKKQARSEVVTLFGAEVEFRQPSLQEVLARDNAADPAKALVQMLVNYCYVPGTDEKVFDSADAAVILKWPVGEWLSDVNEVVERLTGINVQDAEKKSEETAT